MDADIEYAAVCSNALTSKSPRATLGRFLFYGVLASLLSTTAPAALAAEWAVVDSPDVRVISNTSLRQAHRTAAEIALYRGIVSDFFPGWRFDPTVRPTLFVLDRGTWKDYVQPGPGVEGFEVSSPAGHVLATNGDLWEFARPIVFHELSHHILSLNQRGNRFPVWYEEGLADFLSTARVWWSLSQTRIELGLAPEDHLRVIATHAWMPLRTVFAVTRGSREYSDPTLAPSYYAESWLLVHFAFVGDPSWTEGLRKYLSTFTDGGSNEEALAAALPGDHGEFEAKLRSYIFRRQIPLVRRPRPTLVEQHFSERKISDVEGRLELGRFLVSIAARKPSTRAFLETSRRLDNGEVASGLLLANALVQDGQVNDARRLADPVCGGGTLSRDVLSLCGDLERRLEYWYAGLSDGDVDHSIDVASTAAAARVFYERAWQEGDDSVTTLLSYGKTQLLAAGGNPTIRSKLEAMLATSPDAADVGIVVAGLWFSDDPAQSLMVLQKTLPAADSSESAAILRRTIVAVKQAIASGERSTPREFAADSAH